MKNELIGMRYIKTVADVNDIYDQHIKFGLSNREIWKRWIYPKYGISEKTFYNYLNASSREDVIKLRQKKYERI